jgi:NhaP-type Na+/H+ and K+/H+ antiporter
MERRRYDLQEENVSTKWAEFVESVYRNGMTLDSLVLPFHLNPPSLTLQSLALPQGVLVIAIQRQGKFIQPHGGVLLERGDRLTLLGPPQQIIQVLERF